MFLLLRHGEIPLRLETLDLAFAILLADLDDLLRQFIRVALLESLLQFIQFTLIDIKVVRLQLQLIELLTQLTVLLLHLELHLSDLPDAVSLLLHTLQGHCW